MRTVLELVPAIRIYEKCPSGSYESERRFLDFALNGQSLWQQIGKPHDMVSVLCYEYAANETMNAIDRLLLRAPADLPDNRRSLFICSECGDLGCGAMTVVIEGYGADILWRDFGYENNYEHVVLLDDYKHVGPFRFEFATYEQTLLGGLARIRSTP